MEDKFGYKTGEDTLESLTYEHAGTPQKRVAQTAEDSAAEQSTGEHQSSPVTAAQVPATNPAKRPRSDKPPVDTFDAAISTFAANSKERAQQSKLESEARIAEMNARTAAMVQGLRIPPGVNAPPAPKQPVTWDEFGETLDTTWLDVTDATRPPPLWIDTIRNVVPLQYHWLPGPPPQFARNVLRFLNSEAGKRGDDLPEFYYERYLPAVSNQISFEESTLG